MNNLYEYFDCKTREELYEKVKKDDLSVRSLVDFIDFSKQKFNQKDNGIISPEAFVKSIVGINMPAKGEVVCLFTSTKLEPVYLSRINLHDESSYRNALKESLNAGSTSVFLLYNESVFGYDEFRSNEFFETFDIRVIDNLKYSKLHDSIKSSNDVVSYKLENYRTDSEQYKLVSESRLESVYNQSDREITSLQGFDEFSSYYASQEVLGMNIIENNIDVKEILKVGYQYDWQESFGVIGSDLNGDIFSFGELFKGSPNASIVDKKVFTKEILSKSDISIISIFHNHPSGFPEPSDEDLAITHDLKNICERLDIQLLDHFIVGKKKVYSFAEEGFDCISDNENYRQSINEQSDIRFRQKSFNLER